MTSKKKFNLKERTAKCGENIIKFAKKGYNTINHENKSMPSFPIPSVFSFPTPPVFSFPNPSLGTQQLMNDD